MLSLRTLILTSALALGSLIVPSTASAAVVSPWVHVQGVGFTDQNGRPYRAIGKDHWVVTKTVRARRKTQETA